MKPLSFSSFEPVRHTVFLTLRWRLLADSLRTALAADPNLLVVGIGIDLSTLRSRLRSTAPEVLLIDLAFPELTPDFFGGLLAFPEGPALVALLPGSERTAHSWLASAGVRWTVSLDDPEQRLAVVVRLAAIERLRLGPIPRRRNTSRSGASDQLTPREGEVLHLLGQDLHDLEIAGVLGITRQTVRYHLTQLYGKLGVSGRHGAVNEATRTGLLRPEQEFP